MKVRANKIEAIEVVIDPVDVVQDMIDRWKSQIRIPHTADLMKLEDGKLQWCIYERGGHSTDWQPYRDASVEQIETYEAFEKVLDVVRNFE